jgi:hypothetical protein
MHRPRKRSLVAIVALALACTGLAHPVASAGNRSDADSSAAPAQPRAIWEMSRSAKLDGAVGGVVQCSRWRVIVPPGAFRGTATVTVTERDIRKRNVELSITPEEANHFLLPVKLVYKRATPTESIAGQSIYWWNPETRAWEPAPSQLGDLTNGTLSSGLLHFSTYAVFSGKAGW